MVNSALTLNEYKHPNKAALKAFNGLIAIDEQKNELLKMLTFMLDATIVEKWKKKHHQKPLMLLEHLDTSSPLIILSGEVGCGKTALAQSIATPLGEKLEKTVKVFETPSNIRGSGLVGEISNRITDAFTSAKSKIKDNELGILIIDEADDIATSRAQNQAHHEDRAGLNVLIKQIDLLKKEKSNMAVIMITNRIAALDPAVRRRTSLHLTFERPVKEKAEEVLRMIFENTDYEEKEFKDVLKTINAQSIPFSFSDLIQRVGKQAMLKAIETDQPFSPELYKDFLQQTEASPLITEINKL
jgi:AAA+ superfamily predicted ATPase